MSTRDRLKRTILIHCCKDRTLTYRNRRQPIFNNVAIPVFSVNNVEEARSLIRMVSNLQYEEHPLNPGDDWFRIDMGIHRPLLEPSDLQEVADKLESAYESMMKAKEQSRLAERG